jgi:hypothetical protein
MAEHSRAGLLAGLAIAWCVGQAAQQTPPAPVPPLIPAATKVFIANGGGDESPFDAPQFSGAPTRLYDEFYAAMRSWGRYELVATPGEADLVFEVRLTILQPQSSHPLGGDANPAYDSQLYLTVRDVKTHQTLWGLTVHAQTAILQANRDKNFEQALARIVAELHRIAGSKQAAAQPPGN